MNANGLRLTRYGTFEAKSTNSSPVVVSTRKDVVKYSFSYCLDTFASLYNLIVFGNLQLN